MDISKKLLLTLLAIFCVIASAGAVCAADAYSDGGYDGLGYSDESGDWAGSQYSDDDQGGYSGSQYSDDDQGGYSGSQYNEDEQGGYAGSQYDVDEQGGYAGSQYDVDEQGGYAGSQYNETLENAAAGEPVNDTVVADNMTADATSSHTMLETGNPILALFAVTAIIGGLSFFKRN
ncbi:MAG: hypothetical protein E7Z79_06310 [Methanobrevibacter thaueri]|uniref:Uncharacterized protein n=1 Tax=Methanobrevibacter thaueri TaxID=190975 RepID=A0A8T3VB03_9EURY|nr:hypothetical protein [Methanobrevibacter thaueri]MBE6502040.1 hypothetical protein [Methanobrevibacter thaueri]